MRLIETDPIIVQRGDKCFYAHPFLRFDPATAMLAMAAVGTTMQVAGQVQQGKQAEKIAKARARIDEQNAEAVRDQAVEAARVEREKGQRLLATQKSRAAAGGIRINVGSPLVIEAETRNVIARDIGFILEKGRVQSDAFRSSAAIERASGKAIKKQSTLNAIGTGLSGFGSIAYMGMQNPGVTKDIGTTVSKVSRGTKSFVGGGGKLNAGPKSLFDINAGMPGAEQFA